MYEHFGMEHLKFKKVLPLIQFQVPAALSLGKDTLQNEIFALLGLFSADWQLFTDVSGRTNGRIFND